MIIFHQTNLFTQNRARFIFQMERPITVIEAITLSIFPIRFPLAPHHPNLRLQARPKTMWPGTFPVSAYS